MHTPGAIRSTSAPKLEKLAKVSSSSARQVGAARPPGLPSKSASAEMVMPWALGGGPRAAGRGGPTARLAVEVGQRRDGHDLVVGGRHAGGGVGVVVAGGHGVGHPRR